MKYPGSMKRAATRLDKYGTMTSDGAKRVRAERRLQAQYERQRQKDWQNYPRWTMTPEEQAQLQKKKEAEKQRMTRFLETPEGRPFKEAERYKSLESGLAGDIWGILWGSFLLIGLIGVVLMEFSAGDTCFWVTVGIVSLCAVLSLLVILPPKFIEMSAIKSSYPSCINLPRAEKSTAYAQFCAQEQMKEAEYDTTPSPI